MFPLAASAARAHALATYPEESCGFVDYAGVYRITANVAPDRAAGFRIAPQDLAVTPPPLAIVHSHCSPRHSPWPTAADMRGQMTTRVPWGIVTTDGETASEPLWFGDHVLDQPLVGRVFAPGVTDCYALVRAYYHQVRGVELPEFPRDDNWWEFGQNLLLDGYASAGFRLIPTNQLQEGDMYFMQLRASVPNHCGIVLGGGLCLHHLAGRLSRREPLGPWMKYVTHGFRHADT